MTEEQERMVLDNQNLIYPILKRYNVSIDDYFDVAMIGLCKGVKTFDKTKGVQVSTYLYRCISNELLMELRQKKVKTISLEVHLKNQNNDSIRLEEMLFDTKTNIENDFIKKNEYNLLYQSLEVLNDKEKFVIEQTFFNDKKTTQKDIALLLNLTQAQVSRIKRDALKKLREELEND